VSRLWALERVGGCRLCVTRDVISKCNHGIRRHWNSGIYCYVSSGCPSGVLFHGKIRGHNAVEFADA